MSLRLQARKTFCRILYFTIFVENVLDPKLLKIRQRVWSDLLFNIRKKIGRQKRPIPYSRAHCSSFTSGDPNKYFVSGPICHLTEMNRLARKDDWVPKSSLKRLTNGFILNWSPELKWLYFTLYWTAIWFFICSYLWVFALTKGDGHPSLTISNFCPDFELSTEHESM